MTALTVIDRVSVNVFAPPLAVPPLSMTVHVRLLLPLTSATVLYVSPCNSASVTTVLAVTCVTPSAFHSVMCAGITVTVYVNVWPDSSLAPPGPYVRALMPSVTAVTLALSSFTLIAAGAPAVRTGASLTGVPVMALLPVTDRLPSLMLVAMVKLLL